MSAQEKEVLIVLPSQGFRDEEYLVVRRILEENGAEVRVASSSTLAEGLGGMTVIPDVTLPKVLPTDYDALVFIGGRGAREYFENTDALYLAREMNSQKKIVAAICYATLILANADILSGKKATICEASEKLKEVGIIYTGSNVEKDENIITAAGPEASEEFAKKIIESL